MPMNENDWPVIHPNNNQSPRLRVVRLPNAPISIPLRDGSACFLIAHYASWFHDTIEPLTNNPPDDWGYAYRENVNSPGEWSRHARGIAADLNATLHPNGKRNTFSLSKRTRIRLRLRKYRGCLRSGIWYRYNADDMHIEIDNPLPKCERVARRLMNTTRGKAILAANPGLREVILS
jgi:hypothetical protein